MMTNPHVPQNFYHDTDDIEMAAKMMLKNVVLKCFAAKISWFLDDRV